MKLKASKLAHAVVLLTCILEMSVSNLGQDIDSSERHFVVFFSSRYFSEYSLKLNNDHFLPQPSKFSIHCHRISGRYRADMASCTSRMWLFWSVCRAHGRKRLRKAKWITVSTDGYTEKVCNVEDMYMKPISFNSRLFAVPEPLKNILCSSDVT